MNKNKWIIKREKAGQRLDMFISKAIGISRKQAKKMIDAGEIWVGNKQVWIAGWTLKENDIITIGSHESKSSFRLKILHEDRDVIAVDKPVGMLSLPMEGSSRSNMNDEVKAYLKRRHPTKSGSYVKPLHRLDTETSGVMIFALSKLGAALQEAFKVHDIKRTYLAIVMNAPKSNSGKIDKPISKGDYASGKKVEISPQGHRAVTFFNVRERYKDSSLLEIETATGRTHQIRVHLASIGCPIIGDKIYGSPNFKRQLLHSHTIAFKHPSTGKVISITSPMPKDMSEMVSKLRE